MAKRYNIGEFDTLVQIKKMDTGGTQLAPVPTYNASVAVWAKIDNTNTNNANFEQYREGNTTTTKLVLRQYIRGLQANQAVCVLCGEEYDIIAVSMLGRRENQSITISKTK